MRYKMSVIVIEPDAISMAHYVAVLFLFFDPFEAALKLIPLISWLAVPLMTACHTGLDEPG